MPWHIYELQVIQQGWVPQLPRNCLPAAPVHTLMEKSLTSERGGFSHQKTSIEDQLAHNPAFSPILNYCPGHISKASQLLQSLFPQPWVKTNKKTLKSNQNHITSSLPLLATRWSCALHQKDMGGEVDSLQASCKYYNRSDSQLVITSYRSPRSCEGRNGE